MKTEKRVYKSLKWLFSFFVGVMGVATISFLALTAIFQLQPISQVATLVNELALEKVIPIETLSSPLFSFSIIINLVLYGVVFLLGRIFFKNLENEQIFVDENVRTSKKVALILLILSVTSGLPDVIANLSSTIGESYFLDLTYIVGAAIVWALAKILEKANIIAEENQLTI